MVQLIPTVINAPLAAPPDYCTSHTSLATVAACSKYVDGVTPRCDSPALFEAAHTAATVHDAQLTPMRDVLKLFLAGNAPRVGALQVPRMLFRRRHQANPDYNSPHLDISGRLASARERLLAIVTQTRVRMFLQPGFSTPSTSNVRDQ